MSLKPFISIPALAALLLGCSSNKDENGPAGAGAGGARATGQGGESAGSGGETAHVADAGMHAIESSAMDAGAAETEEKVSRPGAYQGYSQKMYSGYVVSSQYVEVRDGTKIAIDLYRPKERTGKAVETPLPVLWMHTPYARRAPLGVMIGEVYPGSAAFLVEYGYVVGIADFRGLYASFGQNAGYNRGEWVEAARMDAYDITEWLAQQPWSTGKIGMWGCSATGGSQMQAATTAPPSLKAVFPMSCEFDAYPFGVPGGMAPDEGPTRSPPSTTDEATRNLLAAPVDADANGSQLQAAIASHGPNLDNLGYMPNATALASCFPCDGGKCRAPTPT